MIWQEANFDGLIGPTHNYGGLSAGNLASQTNEGDVSRPREAALQGLAKMRRMHDAGLWQGVLPPHERPFTPVLVERFGQPDLARAWEEDPALAKAAMSASPMWAANAATVSPSPDTADGKLHMSAANLSTLLHRSLEGDQTARSLRRAMPFATVHDPLPLSPAWSDEGAANHVRLCGERGWQGVELFVWGRDGAADLRFPARQTLRASRTVARRHGLDPTRTVFARQSPTAIEAGAFHNDVVCVGAMETLFFHEDAFADTDAVKRDVRAAAKGLFEPVFVEVPREAVPLEDAVSSYLFNSMLVRMPGEARLTLVAPTETQESERARVYCERFVAGNGPIGRVDYVDVRQSMRNGGGPACLRLRVTMSEGQWSEVREGFRFSESLHERLGNWVEKHYREELSPDDLRDPALLGEAFEAIGELARVMDLGERFFPVQRRV